MIVQTKFATFSISTGPSTEISLVSPMAILKTGKMTSILKMTKTNDRIGLIRNFRVLILLTLKKRIY